MGTVTVRAQLIAAHKLSSQFDEIVADYMHCVHRIRELEVRNGQLDREAGEMRSENDTLLQTLEEERRGRASSAELQEARASLAAVQTELLAAYKEKSESSEAKSTALEQLEVVRDNYARQSAELDAVKQEEQRLKAEVAELRNEVAKMVAARELSTKELQARDAAAQAATDRAAALEDENRDLVERLLELKDREVERMNEMNRLRDDMLNDARRQAAEVVARARAQLTRQAGSSAAAGVLDASMRSLDMAAENMGAAALPSTVLRVASGVHKGGCFAITFDSAGQALATCGADKLVRLWDTTRGIESAVLRGAHEGVNDVAFTCDSRMLLGAEDRNAIRIWEVQTGRLAKVALTGHMGKVTGVATIPTDPSQAVSVSADRSLKVWNVERGVCQRSLHCPSTARRVAALPDASLVVSGHFDGRLRFWDIRSRHSEPVHEVEVHGGREIFSVAAAIAGGLVATIGRDNAVCIVDTRRFSMLSRLSAPTFEPEVWATAALNASSSHVAAGSKEGTVFLWDISSSDAATSPKTTSGVSSPQRLRQPKRASREQQGAAVVACAWSPAGLPLVTSDRLGGVTFWGESQDYGVD